MTTHPRLVHQRLIRLPEARPVRARLPFLRRLSDTDRQQFLRAARRATYQAGDTLLAQDTHPDLLLLVLRGHLLEAHTTRDGDEVILDVHGPGDLVGTVDAVDGHAATATVRANTRSDVLTVPGPVLRSLLADAPSLTVAVLDSLAGRARQAEQELIRSITQEVLPRVACRLVEMVERWGQDAREGIGVTLHLSQAELASWTGVSREAAVKALKVLRDDGLIDTGRRQVTVTDLDGLRAYCAA